MGIDIVDYRNISADVWNSFVEECDESWLYHRTEIIDLCRDESRSFAVVEDDKIVAICVLYVNKCGNAKVLGYKTGPAGLALLNSGHNNKLYPLIQDYLLQLATMEQCSAIQLYLPSLAPAYRFASYLDSHLFNLRFTSCLRWGFGTDYTDAYTNVIDLTQNIDIILSGFSKGNKHICKKLGKLPFVCRYVDATCVEDSEWQVFVANHLETFNRTNTATFSPAYFDSLLGLLKHGHFVLVNVYAASECCASILLGIHKKRATYFAGATPSKYLNQGYGVFIHFLAMQELIQRGFEYYELGIFFPAMQNCKLQQIGEFKRKFGGIRMPLLAGELVINEYEYLMKYVLKNMLGKFVSLLKARIKTRLKRNYNE